MRSGFSNELFKHITTPTKCSLTEKLLKFVVLKLPDSQISTHPYNASFMDLRVVLQKTTDGAVIKCLLKWGVRVKEEDVIYATRCLSDSQVDTYELILSRSTHRDDPLHSCVNIACNEALKMRKRNFVVALVKRGSTPPPNQLFEMGDVLDDPYVQSYLETVMHASMYNHQYEPDFEPSSDDEQMSGSSGKVNRLTVHGFL